ncbi:MAG: molybdate ABC transporter permease subunit [Tepidisphaeraceae bacterium]
MTDIRQPLLLSLQIALVATALVTVVTIPLALLMSRRQFAGKSVAEALITLPLVLPPTVVGYFIIATLGARGWLGQWLNRWFGYSIVFRFEGAVLASAIVALPLLYMPAKAAFSSVERESEDLARTFGANALQTFWHVTLPLARRGILSGLLLAFARALGEFGATMMVFGWQPARLTLPISVYADYDAGEMSRAGGAVVALSVISLVLILAYNHSGASKQE